MVSFWFQPRSSQATPNLFAPHSYIRLSNLFDVHKNTQSWWCSHFVLHSPTIFSLPSWLAVTLHPENGRFKHSQSILIPQIYRLGPVQARMTSVIAAPETLAGHPLGPPWELPRIHQGTSTRSLDALAPCATAESLPEDAKLSPTEVVAFSSDVPAPASMPRRRQGSSWFVLVVSRCFRCLVLSWL